MVTVCLISLQDCYLGPSNTFPQLLDQLAQDFLGPPHPPPPTSSGPFACSLCPKTLSNPVLLQKHLEYHKLKQRPGYECSVCGKKSVYLSNHKKHMRIHTGEKPYWCQYCPYRTGDRSNLKAHMVTHTANRQGAQQFGGPNQ